MAAQIAPLSPAETAATLADVLVPLAARGLIVRRQRVTGLLARLDADRRAVRRLQRLRARHGPGPVIMKLPGRRIALVLDPGDALRVLAETPEPFDPANREKRAALERFEPHGVLVSPPDRRPERRRFNETVLQTGHPVHALAERFGVVIAEEAETMLAGGGELDWDRFAPAWWRIVRRIVLGDDARGDEALTDDLAELRSDANWAFAKPRRGALRARFLARLRTHLARAEPGSLAAVMATADAGPQTYPVEQVPQWLFAFDAAGQAAFTALALLDAHPSTRTAVGQEIAAAGPDLARAELPRLRATVLESVRLWPTTPGILRDTRAQTEWRAGTLPADTAVVVFVPFFHRDAERLPEADRFAPELWLDRAERDPGALALFPFSQGQGECPGRDLVLLTTSTLLAHLLRRAELRQRGGPLRADRLLPATLSPFGLRFVVSPATAPSASPV